MKKTTDKHDPDLRPNIKELSGLKISAIKPLIESIQGAMVTIRVVLCELEDALDDVEGAGK